jgi:DNA topoisomerase-3
MLILTEKPSVAKDFAAALGASGRKGYYASDGAVITYCVGHLFELYNPQDYDPKYGKWELKDLPILPHEFLYQMNISTKEQAAVVIDILKLHKNDEIIVATDAGREGEPIARIAIQEAGITDISRFKRFWVSEALTKDVILSGLKNALPLSEYNALSEQGFARQKAGSSVSAEEVSLLPDRFWGSAAASRTAAGGVLSGEVKEAGCRAGGAKTGGAGSRGF